MMLRAMFYPKNVPNVERVIRIIIGGVLIASALSGRSFLGALFPGLGTLAITLSFVSAVIIIMTGFFGWCPACALVGRKIKRQQRDQ